jgi:hypothetical protein
MTTEARKVGHTPGPWTVTYETDVMFGLAWEWTPEKIAAARQRLSDFPRGMRRAK